MAILENIQSLCEMNGISIPKLEKELGFGKGSMYKWNTNSPSIDKVQKVADYFHVSLDRVVYGFDVTEFVQLVNYVKEKRTIEQFAKETGVDVNELYKICLGLIRERPSYTTVQKIASSNPVDYLVSTDDLMEAAGYRSKKQEAASKEKQLHQLIEQYESSGFTVRREVEDDFEKVYIEHPNHGTVASMFLHDFLLTGNSFLHELTQRYKNDDIQTIAAHHNGEDWTEEELEEIERFKEFVRMKRKQKRE